MFFLQACSTNYSPFQVKDNSDLLLNKTIEKTPFHFTYLYSSTTDTELQLFFLVSHTDESPISSADYEFQIANYLFDENEVPYEVIYAETYEDTYESEQFEEFEMLLKLSLTPPPEEENVSITLPIYVVPSLFKEGYPFRVHEDHIRQLSVGDISISHLSVDGKTLSFQLRDEHPDQSSRKLSYTFNKIDEGQSVYPLFTRIESINETLSIELEFAQEIRLPSQFSIHRTTVHLPEWRFSLTVPLHEKSD